MMSTIDEEQFNIEEEVSSLFDAVCGLAKANYLTGVNDNKAHNMRLAKTFDEFTHEDSREFYETRALARYHVEQRALHRGIMEQNFKKIVNLCNINQDS